MKKLILPILAAVLFSSASFASNDREDNNGSQQFNADLSLKNNIDIANRITSNTTLANKNYIDTTAKGGNAYVAPVTATADSNSIASTGAIKNSAAGGASQSGSSVSFNQEGTKYPNQAPPVYSTSAPSFSQRNCTPVGSVNASGPFGGLGVAFPMGGDICNGLNEADKVGDWERESGDAKLWLVQCNLMVQKDSDLGEAFEESGYSCKDAYIQRQAKINADAKQRALMR